MGKRVFKYKSAFDIIGPIMVGPSSSHTAGAVKIGKMARDLFRKAPTKLVVTFYGSFAETYKGHGTAVAIVAGVLGYETSDERIPDAIEYAEEQGIVIEFLVSQKEVVHANTVNLVVEFGNEQLNLTAISIGGGSIQLTEINYHSIVLAHHTNGLVVTTYAPQEVAAMIYKTLEEASIITVQKLNQETVLFVETASELSQKLLTTIRQLPGIITALSTAS